VKSRPVQIAPSILSADFAALGRDIAAAERGGADLIHVDVMDGHFVPNITIGPPVVRAIRRVATRPLDVHLMIEDPDRFIEEFVAAGASMVSVHVEVVRHLNRTVSFIRKLGAKAGVVINPATPASSLEDIAPDVDFVLVMSVNPGFGGQAFIPHSLEKLRRVRSVLDGAAPPPSSRLTAVSTSRTSRTSLRLARTSSWPARRSSEARTRRPPPASCVLQPINWSVDNPRTRITRVRVRYADTDQMGVVYYANYLVWFEIGRTEWLRDAGWNYRDMEETGVALPVIEAHCEYRQPARYDDEIEIRTTATAMTPARLRFDYQAVRVAGDQLIAEGHTVHAALGANGRPCRLPSRVRELLG